ncbi:transporter substrate-binding domain-containing protein [Azospirillum sp. B510]|uniref:transporter substrate-binding domain-containing protein n=1 Tax=Azospirillum sp. (strain B510) TaxID=137722 RepID=UPI0002FE514D|nr:transporter substrate-binding domain-containing protein [Azospirillum sp. B510]
MNLFRLAAAASLAALMSGAIAGAAQADATLDRIKQRGSLVAGVILSGAPFGYIDAKSQEQKGFNIDLATELARGLGVKLETVTVTPPNRVQFLQQGKVDLLIANMSWTEERAEMLDFVPTAFERSGGIALGRKGTPVKDWPDLKGKTVCLSQGANFTKPLAEEIGAKIKGFPSQPDSLLALKGGQCDAAVHTGATLRVMLLDHPEDWKDYEILTPTDLLPSLNVIWVRKGETDAREALDGIMRRLHGSGWIIDAAERNRLAVTPYFLETRDANKGR